MKSTAYRLSAFVATLSLSFGNTVHRLLVLFRSRSGVSTFSGIQILRFSSIWSSILFFLFAFPSQAQEKLGSFDSLSSSTIALTKTAFDSVNLPTAIPTENKFTIPTYKDSIFTPNKKRIWALAAANVAVYGGSLVLLNEAWYKKEPRTSFQVYNDSKEWQQVDKIGHGWSAYNLARASSSVWRWAGLSPNQATWVGGLSGTLYLTVIEFLDAHSQKWGWSWADMAANLGGSTLFVAQELGWKEQRIQYKFSFHKKSYEKGMLSERADNLYGASFAERMLKDYNGQTYWLSANLKSFFKDSNIPAWLNIAIGYGADGMFGGYANKWTDNGFPQTTIDRSDIPRIRQFYLAPDIDLTKIKTQNKFLKTVFFALNSFKIPAPTLQLDSKGKLRFQPFYF